MSVRALLLDLDGTLADSLPVMRRCYERLLAEHGRQGSDEEFRRLNGPRLAECAALVRQAHGLWAEPDSLLQRWFDLIAEEYRAVAPNEGAEALVRAAVGKGWRVAVVTSSGADLARRWLRSAGLQDCVATIVSGGCVARGKPAPDPYLEALRRLGAAAEDGFAVEDTPTGAAAARAAGIPTWGLSGPGATAWPPGVRSLRRLADLMPLLDQAALRWHALGPDLVIAADENTVPIAADLRAAVDAAWAEETAGNPKLFDGEILSLRSASPDLIEGAFVPFRMAHAARKHAGLRERLALRPLAVSGLARCRDGLILGRRAPEVTGSPGRWELAPSGGIDRAALLPGGRVDPGAALRAELAAELGIGPEAVSSCRVAGAVENRADGLWDIVLALEIALSGQEVARLHAARGSGEYDQIAVVAAKAIPAFCDRVAWRLVDATYLSLERQGLLG